MSSGKRFEKTFSRKKKESVERKKVENEGEQIVIPPSSHSQLSKTSENRNNGGESVTAKKGAEKSISNSNSRKKNTSKAKQEKNGKKKVADSPKPKQKQQNQPNQKQNQGKTETQKRKRKVENGEGENKEVKKTKKQTRNGEKQGKEEEKVKEEGLECTFPTNRISRIVKSEGLDYRLSQEAIFLINKATEKFLEVFSEDAYDCAVQDKKSFVGYKHISSAVGKEKRLDFLSDFVPEKVASEKALAETKPTKTCQA